ncbi:MAG TPA: hypothetical protein PK992_04755, partial [Planctomycetaceae bacterium]|nr:hypothetical protein [Planctomycetaceae bacterium]
EPVDFVSSTLVLTTAESKMLKKFMLAVAACSLVLVLSGSEASARSRDCCCKTQRVKVQKVRCPKQKCRMQHCCEPTCCTPVSASACASGACGDVSGVQSMTPVPDSALTPTGTAEEAPVESPSPSAADAVKQ